MRLLPLFGALALGMVAAAIPARAESKGQLRLMTYNVNYGNTDIAGTLDAIERADADVVLLQEITHEWQRALVDRLGKRYAHRVFRVHARAAGGLAVLSRYAITAEEVFPSPERGWFPAERLVIDSPFGAVQVLNVHLRPAIANGSWIKGYLTTPPLRRREIESYWRKMKKDMPTIIAGDFNEEASGSALAFLAKQGLARVATAGPKTWRYSSEYNGKVTDLLKLDIDHVMLDGRLVGSDAEVLDAGGSDHRPVVVTIAPAAS